MAEYRRLSHRLDQTLRPDPHNGVQGYTVRSLYFDTPFDEDFYEKQDGVECRRKIRLRCYDPDQQELTLEIKQKQGIRQHKRGLTVTREDAGQLNGGHYGVHLQYGESLAAELYGLMQRKVYRPKAIVEYQRKAYIARENQIRITFDHCITATESRMALLDRKLLLNPVLDPYDVVMEVKYNGFLLSYIQSLLQTVDKSEFSVSKYCLARQHVGQTHI